MSFLNEERKKEIINTVLERPDREWVSRKRLRTPSPVVEQFDKQLKKLHFLKSRMKYASMTPQDFIPAEIFRFFPEIRGDYRLVASFKHIAQDSIDDVIASIKDLLLHAILVPYEGSWLLIPQVEAYYHEKEVDDVAQNDSHFPYSNISKSNSRSAR